VAPKELGYATTRKDSMGYCGKDRTNRGATSDDISSLYSERPPQTRTTHANIAPAFSALVGCTLVALQSLKFVEVNALSRMKLQCRLWSHSGNLIDETEAVISGILLGCRLHV
jgi:hypothetical protein